VRILHLADHMGYGDTVPHGMTTYLLIVLPRVRAAGHELMACFLRGPHNSGRELQRQGIPTRFLNTRRYDPTIPMRVARIIGEFKPDLVHATQVQAVAVARLLRGMRARYPLLLHMHNLDVLPAPLRWVNHHLPQPELALCVSKAAMGPAIEQFGLAPQVLRVFYNAFDGARFADNGTGGRVREELGIAPAAPVVGRAARFCVDKANDRLVRAMPEVLRRVPDAHAILAGDGPERADCEALARGLGVAERTHFLGHRTDVARVVAACDVMTVTSPEDTYPYAALEAYALAKPVIGYRAGGMPELVEPHVTGLLAEPDDHLAFAEHIAHCLADRSLSVRLGAAGKEFVKRFTIDVHVRDLLDIYESTRAAADNREVCAG
jgi:glycosyltransferase involved in cell wall biosynthesis